MFAPYSKMSLIWMKVSYFCFAFYSKFLSNEQVLCEPTNLFQLILNANTRSHTGVYWPSVIFVRTLLHSVHTATTLDQHSPARLLRLVSKRLIINITIHQIFLVAHDWSQYGPSKTRVYPVIFPKWYSPIFKPYVQYNKSLCLKFNSSWESI